MKRNPGLAKALYSNTPEAPNELLFRKGDILTVIEYDYDGQPGWWLCAHRGQRGICPSNYLELLEDKYSIINRNNRSTLERNLSQSGSGENCESAPGLIGIEGEGKANKDDPLETYDVPRSCVQNLSKAPDLVDGFSTDPVIYSNQPLYQNEDSFSPITKTSSFELYDVPRSQLPIYGQSIARLRKYGEASESSLASCGIKSLQHNNNSSNSSFTRSSSSSDLGLPPSGNTRRSPPVSSTNSLRSSSISNISTIRENSAQNSTINNRSISQTSGTSQVQLRKPHHRLQNYPNPISKEIPVIRSNRSSIQSESAESGIVMVSSPPMQDLYDVPRSAVPVQVSSGNGNGTSSRPQSSLSISSSGMGLSIANSDSKDSLDLYDVPRSAKSYVNHMETKYDQVQSRHDNPGGTRDSASSAMGRHSRHNSTSSIFSAYGYTRGQGGSNGIQNRSANFSDNRRPSLGVDFGSRSSLASASSSTNAQNYPSNDLYDVPRSSCPPPPNPRTNRHAGIGASSTSIASSVSQASLISESDTSGMLYDVPSSFTRKVSLCDSTETLSCKETFGEEAHELKLGASSSSLSSSSSNHLRSASQCNNDGSKLAASGTSCSSEVKILPLGPKAAVSVCEKLRHEVITSITSILDLVKPKWRSKENLTVIMPDLRFNCVRLSLAIKDIADFCTRSMSNAKQVGDEALLTKLHRLLAPVMNGSQIVQRDVDELEAYFWSVDRLSISQGSYHQKNMSGDALDQLILCARSLKHDVTEIANFLALNSSALFRESDRPPARSSVQVVEAKVEDTQEDYDYVSLMSTSEATAANANPSASSSSSLKHPPTAQSAPVPLPQLDSRDEQLLEFYSAQIGVTAPLLSQSISTFISAIHQNEPPESFNVHLKYIILLAYKLLFAGDTIHRNVNNAQLKVEIESKANDLHKSILALYEASKVATVEFPKIGPMQSIVDKVWSTTQSATQLKKVIFSAICTSV